MWGSRREGIFDDQAFLPRAAGCRHRLSASFMATVAASAAAPAAPAEAPAAPADDQSTSANQAGQANDRQSLTTSDIIVTARAAQAAPLTASLTTTQPQAAISREFIDNANAASDFNELIALTPGVSISGTGNGPVSAKPRR
jgi:iron complex outermembrane receptor protein